MNEFLKMDIFFLVTTIAVVLFASLGTAILWRLVRILKNIDRISEQIASVFNFFGARKKQSRKND
ncbi:MAG: hypothetical protein PHD04_03730 [Candidatus Pacebacteria bacterium]|nr:hypothetical protein [Candidatus Paceibacterota bacterium]